MSKEIFKFKQFDVGHKHGFKVSTEACIFGAYISKNFPAKNVLDIGTGTGLLSLMYAQNNIAHIKAIELDQAAAEEARHNFLQAPFSSLELINEDVLTWQNQNVGKFDLIISNPPFYKDHLLGVSTYQNAAKHQAGLNLDTLAQISAHLSHEQSLVCILLPVYEQNIFQQKIAMFDYSPYKVLNVYNKPANPQFRKIVVYKKANTSEEDKLVIYNEDNTYTEEFKKLMQEYYIIF